MFGVLMITLLLTIALVGSNMDVILKQGIVYQVRAEITEIQLSLKAFQLLKNLINLFKIKLTNGLRHLDLMSHGIHHKELGLLCIKY